jgi:hypothetical protein
MPPYILNLSALQATLETVGGKGMSLAKLTRAGLPVPDGFLVCLGDSRAAGLTDGCTETSPV